MKRMIIRLLVTLVTVASTLQLYACGTLMYPERRGQRQGEIDIKVAVLDGIGLLFFIVPGVIAYIVDFTTGAIYLPAGKRNMVHEGAESMKVVYADPAKLYDPEYVRAIVARESGIPSVINWDREISRPLVSQELRGLVPLRVASASN